MFRPMGAMAIGFSMGRIVNNVTVECESAENDSIRSRYESAKGAQPYAMPLCHQQPGNRHLAIGLIFYYRSSC
jgi:hypothetical protein